jgi:hypothetical protein
MVRWLIGLTPSLSKVPQEPTKWQKVANDTSNSLTLPLALHRGRHKPLIITGGGQEQSPTLANASKLLKPSRWWQPPRETRIPQQINHQVPTRCNFHNANALGSLNLTSNMQRSKRDEWKGSCLAQNAHKYVKCSRDGALSWPTSIYRRTPSNIAVTHLKTLQSR